MSMTIGSNGDMHKDNRNVSRVNGINNYYFPIILAVNTWGEIGKLMVLSLTITTVHGFHSIFAFFSK